MTNDKMVIIFSSTRSDRRPTTKWSQYLALQGVTRPATIWSQYLALQGVKDAKRQNGHNI
jgi:hypothetical protein